MLKPNAWILNFIGFMHKTADWLILYGRLLHVAIRDEKQVYSS